MSNFSDFFGGGGIKSIQRGKSTLSNSANNSWTVTISAVNPAKTELRLLGYTSDPASWPPHIELTNATTITVTRVVTLPIPTTVSWELTEHN